MNYVGSDSVGELNLQIAASLHFDDPSVVSFALSPGWVATDLGKAGAEQAGMPTSAMISAEKSVAMMLPVIDAATRGTHGGRFLGHDGSYRSF